MSLLTIVTINRNNASGLEKTMQSVMSQDCDDFEYVVVDGASKDGSVDVIRHFSACLGNRLKWVSEPDKGIYNAMNKGIGMSSGSYLEFLNSGDSLVSECVVGKVYEALKMHGNPSILYGNMLKDMRNGKVVRDRSFAGEEITFLGFFNGTINHSASFIRKDLFDRFGQYDESLKIVSDWKWFMQVVAFGGEKPVYADIDISLFDMSGISETNSQLTRSERQHELECFVSPSILSDYRQWAPAIRQMKRIQRHPWAERMVYLIDRFLFRLEKR